MGKWKDIDSELEDDLRDQEDSELLSRLKQHLITYYKPVTDPLQAEVHHTTLEIWQQLQKLYPKPNLYGPDLVAEWLEGAGFKFFDYGDMRLEWMMKKA